MKDSYNLFLLMAFTLLVFSLPVQSQTKGQIIVAGRVTDVYDEPLAGANVYVRGDIKNGTSTDVNGYYYLELPGIKDIFIEASFLGMKPRSVPIPARRKSISFWKRTPT